MATLKKLQAYFVFLQDKLRVTSSNADKTETQTQMNAVALSVKETLKKYEDVKQLQPFEKHFQERFKSAVEKPNYSFRAIANSAKKGDTNVAELGAVNEKLAAGVGEYEMPQALWWNIDLGNE